MSESLLERDPMAAAGPPGGWVEHRRAGMRLLGRLVAYHAGLAACLWMAVAAFPDLGRLLPVGGVRELLEAGAQGASKRPDLLLSPADTARQLMMILIGTWLLMLPISWVHKAIHRVSIHDRSMDETVLILPGIVAGIVLIVQHSLALAFSLAGIIAGVQFRRSLQDTFDALFILAAIGTGIAGGIRALEIATVLTVFFTYSTLYVHYFGDGLESNFQARKKAEKKLRKKLAEATAKDDDDD